MRLPSVTSASALASKIQLPDDYASLRCLPAYDGDDCLPTGYVRALASKSDADRELWELELLIDSMNDKVAEPRLRDFMKRYPRRYEPTWMMSKISTFGLNNYRPKILQGEKLH